MIITEEKANKIFRHIYKNVVSDMGHDKVTTGGELARYGRHYFGNKFMGVFPQDRLPQSMYNKNNTKYALLNVDSSGMPGSHWVGVAGIPNSTKILIYDSFGRKTSDLLPILSQAKGGTIDTDYDAEQKKIQDSCGQFSLAWLRFLEQFGPKIAKMI